MTREQILKLVVENVAALVDTFPENNRFEVNEDTVLFGSNSSIDSLSLVSIIVDLEGMFSDEYGFDISLTDDQAMTRSKSPFTNVQSLADYIFELISKKQNA